MGNKKSKINDPIIVKCENEHQEPSKLKNIFLLGVYDSHRVEFMRDYCDNIEKHNNSFLVGDMKFGLNTNVWMYNGIGDLVHEAACWDKAKEILGSNYLILFCYPYGERFDRRDIKNYLAAMNKVFRFTLTKIDIMMIGGSDVYKSDYFRYNMSIYKNDVTNCIGTWLPQNVPIISWISGSNISIPQKADQAIAFIDNQRSRFIKYIREYDI